MLTVSTQTRGDKEDMKAESQLLCCHDHTGPLDERIVMITRCDVVVLLYSIFLGRQKHLQPISLHSGVACFPRWSEGLARFILLLKATPEERAPGRSQDTDQLKISAHKDDTRDRCQQRVVVIVRTVTLVTTVMAMVGDDADDA